MKKNRFIENVILPTLAIGLAGGAIIGSYVHPKWGPIPGGIICGIITFWISITRYKRR